MLACCPLFPMIFRHCRFSRSFGADKWGVVATTVVGAERTWPALRPTAMPDLCLTSLGILAVLSMGGGQDQSVCEKAEEVVCVALAEFCRTSHRPISALSVVEVLRHEPQLSQAHAPSWLGACFAFSKLAQPSHLSFLDLYTTT